MLERSSSRRSLALAPSRLPHAHGSRPAGVRSFRSRPRVGHGLQRIRGFRGAPQAVACAPVRQRALLLNRSRVVAQAAGGSRAVAHGDRVLRSAIEQNARCPTLGGPEKPRMALTRLAERAFGTNF